MFNFDNFEWNITMLALHETVKVWPIWTGALTFMLTDDQLLDVIASPSTHPVSVWVSGMVIVLIIGDSYRT